MTDQIGLGLVGAGQIAYSTADAINRHSSARVVAATDTHPGRLAALCEAKSIEHACPSFEALLDNKAVDGIYIAVPNKFHASLAIQALEAGKHVLLEKPFAMNYAEAQAVVDTAVKSGKIFTVGMNQRFNENHQKIRTLVQEGVLGDIYHAKAFWMRRAGIPTLGTWFGKKDLAGGGCINDIGVHFLDLCLYTIDNFSPVSVSASTYTRFGNRGLGGGSWGISDKTENTFDVEDFASALIKFENGLSVVLDASWACHQETPNRMGVLLYGDEAGADVATAKVFRSDPLREEYDVIEKVRAVPRYAHCCRFANFINSIRGEEEPCATHHQALVIQKILDGIQESSRTGNEVKL